MFSLPDKYVKEQKHVAYIENDVLVERSNTKKEHLFIRTLLQECNRRFEGLTNKRCKGYCDNREKTRIGAFYELSGSIHTWFSQKIQ